LSAVGAVGCASATTDLQRKPRASVERGGSRRLRLGDDRSEEETKGFG